MGTATRIVILGGGYGGVHAAKILHKQFKKNPDVEITLIDRNPYHTLMTELHEIAGSRTEPEAVQVSFKKIFGGTKVNVVIDEIDGVDFEAKALKSDVATYPYDYLVIGAGGAPEFFGIPGVQQNSFTLWSLEDAIRIRTHVENMFREAAKEPHRDKHQSLLTFVIAGAGFTGIELAGELMERSEVLCAKYHINPADVSIKVVEAKDNILPTLVEGPQKAAAKYLKKKGVEVMTNSPITQADVGSITLADGTKIVADTFIWTCGIQGSPFTSRINLTKGQCSRDLCSIASPEGIHGMAGCSFDDDERYIVGERGRILVNKFMQSIDRPDVYLVGDILWFLENEKVLPQIVETALQTAEVAAKNIIADVSKQEKHEFKSNYHGFMVSIGGRYGVAHVGGMSMYGIFAMAVKHLINVHYLFGIAGVNAVWEYLQEEFFRIKDKRSVLHGHAAAKIPAYWALPARLWLGLMWVIEGSNKIADGWFKFDRSRSSWMFSRGVAQAGSPVAGAADATSAASEDWDATAAATDAAADTGTASADGWGTTADSAGDGATDAAGDGWGTTADSAGDGATDAAGDGWGTTTDAATDAWGTTTTDGAADATSAASEAWDAAGETAVDATAAASEAWDATAATATETAEQSVGWFKWDTSKPILGWDSWLVVWFRETFMDGMAAFLHFGVFQVMIVLVEIAIGLALMGGLFTWPAAVVSIGLCVVFVLSGMFAWSQLWFVFLAVVMLGGAGHVAGLDHYVLPWLKKWWNGTVLAKKTYLYLGEPTVRWSNKKKG